MPYRICICIILLAFPAFAADEKKDAIEVIAHNIDPGKQLELDHSVVIQGDVGDYAVIHITNGGVQVRGNVGSGAVIQASGASVEINQDLQQGNTHVEVQATGAGNSIIVNGEQVNAPTGLSGIEIKGEVGDGTQLGTNGSIKAGRIGNKAQLTAGNSIQVGQIRQSALLQADNSINGADVGPNARLIAGNSIQVADIATGAHVQAHNSVIAKIIAPGAYVKAGNSINATYAQGAELHQGNSVAIGK